MVSLVPCRLYVRSCLLETLPYKAVKLKRLPKSRYISTSLPVNADDSSPSTEKPLDSTSSTSTPENKSPPAISHRKVSAPQLPYQTKFSSATPSVAPSTTPASAPPPEAPSPPTTASEPEHVNRHTKREPPPPSILPRRYRPDSPDGKKIPSRFNDQLLQTSPYRPSKPDNLPRQLPTSSRPDPVIPANASLFPRISLAPESFSKIPARMWSPQRPGALQKSHNPFAPVRLFKERQEKERPPAPPPTLYQNPNHDAIQETRNREKFLLPPVPTPDAVHCVISPVPQQWLPSDVLHLIPWDHSSTKQTHPVEVSRIYLDPCHPDDRVVLRFSHPKHLQNFLKHLPKVQVAGRELEAQLFYADAEKKKVKPFTVLRRQDTPDTMLKPRRAWFGDSGNRRQRFDTTNTTTIVVVSGIPASEKIHSVQYWARYMMEDEKFDWAYQWIDTGYGDTSPSKQNVVCIEPRHDPFSWARRWAFILKDEENAWRFARMVDKTYYRTDRFEDTFEISARVMN